VYGNTDNLHVIDLHLDTSIHYVPLYNHSTEIPTESPEFELARALCELLTIEFLYDYKNAMELIFCLAGMEHSERMHQLIHSTCARASNYEWKWVNTTIRSFKYSGFGINKLRKWAEECTNKQTVSKVIQLYPVHSKKEYSYELFAETMQPTNHTVIQERYLSNSSELQQPFSNDITTLIIKSHLGTGKHSSSKIISLPMVPMHVFLLDNS
jgi:hypothetical protein